MKRKLTQEQQEDRNKKIIRMHKAGVSMKKIQRESKLSRSRVYYIISQA